MPDLLFDGKKISVPAGTNLVEAGAKAGVSVPIFCYHKDLGAVGACRVCAVTVAQAGKSRMVMGCMTEAQEGMEVTTLDPQSCGMRKWVLEWLMVNHPHDCPICDEGGECQLQDLTIAAGHGIRRTHLGKRTFTNQYLGEFIVHEMNRCITCYRCSRFYQEVAGGRDFGATGSRDRVYFGRFEEGPLESPFSGNLVELCPTGVFTDKLFRYRSRVWDLEMAPSICPHCSVGCNVLPGARHRELQRVRVRENRAVNGAFLCDRGQFGHGYVMDPKRPLELRVHSERPDWGSALGLTSGALLEIARRGGASRIALITSPRASLETHFALAELASGPLAGARVSHFDDPERETRALQALAALRTAGLPPLEQSDIAGCDVLVVAGASLVDEAPLAALAARQCARHGGRVFVLAPLERYLGDVATVFPTHPAGLASRLRALGGRGDDPAIAAAAEALGRAKRPGLLLGSDLVDGATYAAAAELARSLKDGGREARFGMLFPGPNGFGAAALSSGAVLPGLLADLEADRIEAALLVESDGSALGPRARQALEQLPLLVAMDHLSGGLAERAHAFFPTTPTYESNGAFVNRAGRVQAFAQVLVPSRSAVAEIEHESFRRSYRRTDPSAGPWMAFRVIEALRAEAGGQAPARDLATLRDAMERRHAAWRGLRDLQAGDEGLVVDAAELAPAAPPASEFARASGLAVFRMDRTLGSETLSRRSEPMRTMAGPPVALLSEADARRLGVGERIVLDAAGSTVDVAARAVASVPEGVVLVPRDVEWPIVPAQGATVSVAAAEAQGVTR